jgi:hypothetical protein
MQSLTNLTLLYVLQFQYEYLKKKRKYTVRFHLCRPIKGVCWFTREAIVGLLANLETREQRRQEYSLRDLPPEHPRASLTDDVEGFIALLHEMLGNNFDFKQFYDEFRQFELPSFNEPSACGLERLDMVKVSRRGDPGIFVANRASLPQRNKLTVRASFHKTPMALPPIDDV